MIGDGGALTARRVLALAEEEHALVHADRAEELAGLHERRSEAMAQLPEALGEDAREALRHALALQRQITVALRDGLAVKAGELGVLGHRRTAARGYAPAGLGPRRALDRTA
jgi:hypothetical protein